MAFVRKKKMRGKEYLQAVENRREGGKVRQRVLLHIGRADDYPTLEIAAGSWDANTQRKDGRRTFAYAPETARKAATLRGLFELDEAAVSAERREAERWREESNRRLAELMERAGLGS